MEPALTLPQRAAKIRDYYPQIPTEVAQQHRSFFDEVWNLCGAVMDSSADSGQLFPPSSIMG
jgi:hypothetical protein